MYITMSDIRREILEELTRVRLDKTRLYTLLLKIVDSCECCNKTSAPAPVSAPVKEEPVKEEPVKEEPAPVEVKPKAKATTKKASSTTTKKATTKKAAASTSS